VDKDTLRARLKQVEEERRILNELESGRLALKSRDNQLTERDMRIDALRRDLAALDERAVDLREKKQLGQKRIVEFKQREQEMIDRKKSLTDDLARLEEQAGMEPEGSASEELARQKEELRERLEAQKSRNLALREETGEMDSRMMEEQSGLASAREHRRELSQKAEEVRGRLQEVRMEQARMMEKVKNFEADSRLSTGDVASEIESLTLHKDVLASSLALIKGRYSLQDLGLEGIHSEKEQLREYLQTLRRDHEALRKKASALRIAIDKQSLPRRGPNPSAQAR